ncbi:protein EMBRYONIC FLOWER 1 [Cajanus cajan]|uniref:protein EMBRYONIC FLOWER 1 n=1 Tax=Cajanus cajan TaxID=3821 RepID=UPI0010FB2A77|nr:protein EMBRYONIC FLOWER 1 [Cajanus cajan]XP_029127805.1 protein EMBRYONIC FLOWER 1 [Cajanus cajan]
MGSYIHIDSISIDLADSIGKRDAGKCEHFSIRGYVSEIRKKDWKICWPFPVHESDKQSSLLPLDVPKYSCQRCHKSPQETAAKDIQKDDQTDFGCYSTGCRSGSNAAPKSDVLQDAMLDNLERREIDLNTTLSCVNDYLPTSNEKKAGVVPSRIIDLEIGLEDNLNHLVASVPSPKIYPDLAPEVHTTKRGCESNEVSYPDHASNLKCMEKSSAEMCNGGTPADNQCQKDFIKACTVLGKGTTVMEVGNTYDQTIGPPLESVACNHAVPAGSMDNTTENDSQDHHSEKSTGLSRRRPRKVRLMADLLSDNGESKTEQSSIQESVSHGTSNASAAPQAHPTLPGNFDIQGGLTLTSTGPSRKRKFPLDEVRRTASMCFQGAENEVQNSEGDAKKTDTVLDTRSHSKDVPAGSGLQDATKGHWSKSETDRSHIMMGKKKNKKIHVDNCSIPVQPKGQQRENEDTTDTTDKAYASKTYSSRLTPRAFEGKGMDNFPHHTLRIENEFNLSKGKGKMLQTEAEMDSLLWQKNNTVLQDSCAYSGEKARSSMPITNPIPSVQGVLNGKGPEKGLHLSINNLLVEAHVYNNKKCIHQIENHLPFKMPFQDGTSKVPQLNWKDSDTNVFGGQNIPSKHPTNALSGKGVHCEEIHGARNTQKTIEAVDQLGFMKRYSEQTVEVSEQGTLDDIPMEIVELLAKNQYERCLPDVENRSATLEKSTLGRKAPMTGGSTVHGKGEMSLLKEDQKEKPQGRPKKNNTVSRGENVKLSKRKPVHYFSPLNGNNLGMNNLCPPQSPFGFEVSQSQKKPSSGFQFSPVGSSHLGSARNCRLNGSFEERGSPNATFQAPGGCSLHKNILHQDDEASRIWASLTTNHVSLGYDLPKKAVSSQLPISNIDIASLQSGAFHKQNMKRDIDLNYMNLNAAGLEKLSRNTGPETFSRMNGEYSFPCKHSGMEPHQNLRGSLDLYSNETIPAMHLLSLMDAGMQSSRTSYDVGVSAQMLKRPSYPGDCNTKLEIGTSKPPGTMKRISSDYYSRNFLSDKPHGCFVGSPTFGASSSTPHDKKVIATGFNGQNPTKTGKKEKIKSSNSTLQNSVSKQISWPHIETETSLQRRLQASVPYKIISGNSCMVNRNPADLTIPETGNIYMIRGEDLKFEKSIPKNRPRVPISFGYKQQRNFKGTKMKEHSKH